MTFETLIGCHKEPKMVSHDVLHILFRFSVATLFFFGLKSADFAIELNGVGHEI